MTNQAPGRARAAAAQVCIATAVCVAASGLSAACGPGVATPIPEPPTLVFERIHPPDTAPLTEGTPDGGRHIYGLSGAAPAGSQLRVTNLDRVNAPVVSDVRRDGSFDLNIVVNHGDELRFEWTRGEERGVPQDAHFILDPIFYHLEPSARFACLKFAPGLELSFANRAQVSLEVRNECAFDVSFAEPRARLGLPDFVVQSALPFTIPAGAATELSVVFTRIESDAREDTLLLDITGDAQLIRYPITLTAPAQL